MLPFSKRTPRADEAGEVINTGEFEVIRVGATPKVGQVARVPQAPQAAPRAFQRSISDDEKTMVMPPSSSKPKSNPAPAMSPPTHTLPLPRSRPRPPMSGPNDEHTIVRPTEMLSNAPPRSVRTPTPASPAAPVAQSANAKVQATPPGLSTAARKPRSPGLTTAPSVTGSPAAMRLRTTAPTISSSERLPLST